MTPALQKEHRKLVEKRRLEQKRMEELKLMTPEGRAVPLAFNPKREDIQQVESNYTNADINYRAAQLALDNSRRGDSKEVSVTLEESLKKRKEELDSAFKIMQNARWGTRHH